MEVLLNALLQVAINHHVTDIHFALVKDHELQIELRRNGMIETLDAPEFDERFFRYLMYRSNLDLSRMLEPQTGRFEQEVFGKQVSLRFALVSSLHFANGVLRILNNHQLLNIKDLTLNPIHQTWLAGITKHRNGLYILSGPTGSGKTTTLYTLLESTIGKKIFTLEDPVEIWSEHFIQIQVNEKQNLSYADGIRQLMRHDPDIACIGEIRDEQTAQMAVRLALTGHLVLSSLHAGSCSSAIDRLLELGVPTHQLKDVLHGVSNQRLYPLDNGNKIGVYEVMDRKELHYYFEHQKNSATFKTLSSELQDQLAKGNLSFEKIQSDIDEFDGL